MQSLRPAARLYLATVVVAALVVAILALTHVTMPSPDRLVLAIALSGAALLAQLFPLQVGPKTTLYLDSAVLVAAIILFPPGVAIMVLGTGAALAHVIRRQPRGQTAFNSAQVVLLAGGGSGLLAAFGWRPDRLALDQPGSVLLVVAVSVGLILASALIVATMVALQLDEPLVAAWGQALRPSDPADSLTQLAQIGVGILGAGVAVDHGWSVALLLLPAGSAYQALAHHVRLRRQAEAQLVHRAYHDPLTGLPNRARLLDRLDQALARAGRQGEPVAVLFIDLDRFKLVNDRLGHAAGDRLLIAVADRLRRSARSGDTVARLSGDEFTVLLDGLASTAEAEQLTAGIAAVLEAPFELDGQEVVITASIGVAVAEPGRAVASVALLRDADLAMYRAKARGKARYEIFKPAMGKGVREQAALAADLRRAIDQQKIELAYQPIVDLGTGRIVAVEALARWDHPTQGRIAPDIFIPLAERAGLVTSLGRWVLGEACRQASVWQDVLTAPPGVAINLSPYQFQQPGLVEDVAAALRVTGVHAHRLTLEITEGAMIDDADEAVVTLRQLKGLGVQLVIDDFGTGYSSLAYLQRLPIDHLKVDRQFVAGLGRDAGNTAIVTAVVGLARTMNLVVVAEGVETAEQATLLRDLGCTLAQGYYFGPPQPAEVLTALLEKVTFAVGQRRSTG